MRYVAHGVDEQGSPYLAIEWLDGMNLADSLARGPMPEYDAVKLAIAMAEGLGAAHAAGIVHRDVKPSNVFLLQGSTRSIRLLDFGIAHFEDHALRTETGSMLGTAGYIAPEQARDARSVDARADVFALGCILFHCIAGAPPHGDIDPIQTIGRLLFQSAPRLSSRVPDVLPETDEAVARMLASAPADRPADGGAVAAMLGPILELLRARGDRVRPSVVPADRASAPVISPAVEDPRPSSPGSGARPPPLLVGRRREMEALRAALARSLSGASSAIAVVGEAGIGKSTLLRAVLADPTMTPRPRHAWRARADTPSRHAPWSLAARLVEHGLGLLGLEGRRERQERFTVALSELGFSGRDSKESGPRVLGQLLGLSPISPILHEAASRDAAVLGDAMAIEVAALMTARCRAGPLVCVLEDVHLADDASIALLARALRHLAGEATSPAGVAIVGLLRPAEANGPAAFPGAMAAREIVLSALPSEAMAELVRAAVAPAAAPTAIDDWVRRAAGNPAAARFMIEHGATGPTGSAERARARLARCSPAQARFLAAASVFGASFEIEGVLHALAQDRPAAVRLALGELAGRGLVAPASDEASPAWDSGRRVIYEIVDADLRDAAYESLPAHALRVLHAHAAEHAIREAEKGVRAYDPGVVAHHLIAAEDRERASEPALTAAERAFAAGDLRGASRWASAVTAASVRGRALVVEARARAWLGEHARAEEAACDAMDRLDPGGEAWLAAHAEASAASGRSGDLERLLTLSGSLLVRAPTGSPLEIFAAARCAGQLLVSGAYARADEVLAWIARGAPHPNAGHACAHLEVARAWRGLHVEANPEAMFVGCARAAETLERGFDVRAALRARADAAYALGPDLGKHDDAERMLLTLIAEARRRDLPVTLATALLAFAANLVARGEGARATSPADEALRMLDVQEDLHMRTAARGFRGILDHAMGRVDEADRALAGAIERCGSKTLLPYFLAVLARIRLDQGRVPEGLALAERAFEGRRALGEVPHGTAIISLVVAQAKNASGDRRAFLGALDDARRRLIARARRIESADLRASFLSNVAVNRTTMELAYQCLGPMPSA